MTVSEELRQAAALMGLRADDTANERVAEFWSALACLLVEQAENVDWHARQQSGAPLPSVRPVAALAIARAYSGEVAP